MIRANVLPVNIYSRIRLFSALWAMAIPAMAVSFVPLLAGTFRGAVHVTMIFSVAAYIFSAHAP